MTTLSVIIPTLNAATVLPTCMATLNGVDEIIVVDGGSTDATRLIGTNNGAIVIAAERGRGTQLAAGARRATSDWLLFLHADTALEAGWHTEVDAFIRRRRNGRRAAAFRFALDDGSRQARRLERLVAWRCRALALPYGDQGLLISRSFYMAIGGHRAWPIMEDVELVRLIGPQRLTMLRTRATTSAARWHRDGWWRRSLRNAACLALYGAGVPPRLIARAYGA